MTFLTQPDIRRLSTELAVANTGSYVLRRFASDPVVRALALRPADQLLHVIKRADSQCPVPLEAEVEGYAAAVALSLGGHLAALEQYALARPEGLKWLPHVIAAARGQREAAVTMTSVRQNEYAFKLTPGPVIVSTSSAGSNPVDGESDGAIVLVG